MRWLTRRVTGLALLILPATFAPTALACASTIVNVCGKFSFWVPDDWKMVKRTKVGAERSTYESADSTFYILVGPLADSEADLLDEDVADFIDEELDDVQVASDRRDKVENYNVRLIEGTGKDEGDPVSFRALALDPGVTSGVIQVLVYGAAGPMSKGENKVIVDRILRSLRPQS